MAICYISWMLCSLFLMGPSKLKWAIFLYLTNGTKGVTQQLRSNFMRSNCKQRHQCHTLAKKGTLTLNMPFSKDSIIFKTKYNYLSSFFQGTPGGNCTNCLLPKCTPVSRALAWL